MSNTVGVLVALSVLALAAAVGVFALEKSPQPGRYALAVGPTSSSGGWMFRVDTVTGDVWWTVSGAGEAWVSSPWRPVGVSVPSKDLLKIPELDPLPLQREDPK